MPLYIKIIISFWFSFSIAIFDDKMTAFYLNEIFYVIWITSVAFMFIGNLRGNND